MKIFILENNDNDLFFIKKRIELLQMQVEIVGSSNNIEDAQKIIKDTEPDLLILDIELEVDTSFDLFDFIDYKNYQIIFVTGHDDFELFAFNVEAIGYLIKPVKAESLKQLFEKAIKNIVLRSND